MSEQIPIQCVGIRDHIRNMNVQLDALQEELNHAAPQDKSRIIREISAMETAIERAEEDLATCITNNSGPEYKQAPFATIPVVNTDPTLKLVKKVISWNYLRKKLDEFINLRTEDPLFKVRFHHHDYIPPGQFSPDNDPPASDLTISMIEAVVVNRQVTTRYKPISTIDLGQLGGGFYLSDFNVNKITMNVDPLNPAPLTLKVSFECGGAEELRSTKLIVPNLNLEQFDISVKLSFDVLRIPVAPPVQCAGIESRLNNLNIELDALQEELNHAAPQDKPRLLREIIAKQSEVQTVEEELDVCISTHGGPDPHLYGRLDFLSWIDRIKDLRDDAFEEALKQHVVVHFVTSDFFSLDGTFQKVMRHAIYDQLSNPAIRLEISSTMSRWVLGGTGVFDVFSLTNDGQNVTINYFVPQGKLDPLPQELNRPAGWPYLNNPAPNPAFDFSIPSNLSNIKHIVVLMMENRSFDQMLGYLSLPVSAGGRGRTDVDGLKGGEFNFYNGRNYPSFPFDAGDTAFPIDPSHSYEPTYNQMNPVLDAAGNAIPGSGRMNGFVKDFAEIGGGGDGSQIMGYHTAVNVPVYDALARDFGISHRWFSSHPGPTFCNRFYEVTGRLNLGSGLNHDATHPVLENMWEFNNASPKVPVFTNTIFDYLSEYQKNIEKATTWKYYEDGYCFLRYFSKHTFDDTNVVCVNDPVKGFFADAKNGTLPSVSFIDPHYIEIPPHSNADGPVGDIKAGQELVRNVVEAVVASPQFANTLLVITYDEHGGFYDHVPPPQAVPVTPESPIHTYGVRVPAFFISPWVKAGSVFGHDADASNDSLYFDHTSIIKTIARRFLHKDPPYMGARYAAAKDLVPVLDKTWRRPQFLPFVRHHLSYSPGEMRMSVEGSNAAGKMMAVFQLFDTNEQCFSFEQHGDFVYIRTLFDNRYLTVDVPDGNTTVPAQGFRIKQDAKYEGALETTDAVKFNKKYQLWKFTPQDATNKHQCIISNAFFPGLVLRPQDLTQNGSPVMLTSKVAAYPNVWGISNPVLSR